VKVAERIGTGTLWINESFYITPWTPFAGYNLSSLGVENGTEGLLDFTVPQTISVAKVIA
jgi:acyl-CoA reductase-like NAD-dependent aldehyde dehydrogenase